MLIKVASKRVRLRLSSAASRRCGCKSLHIDSGHPLFSYTASETTAPAFRIRLAPDTMSYANSITTPMWQLRITPERRKGSRQYFRHHYGYRYQ